MKKNTDVRSKGQWQGMNWIRQDKRLAIYLRDGLACAWCNESVEEGVKLTLDHLLPHSLGGSNHEANLVTCCHRCNSARGSRDLEVFASAVVEYLGRGDAGLILAGVIEKSSRPLKAHRKEAKEMIARRGSALNALNAK